MNAIMERTLPPDRNEAAGQRARAAIRGVLDSLRALAAAVRHGHAGRKRGRGSSRGAQTRRAPW